MSRLGDVLGVALTVARGVHEHDIRYPAAALAYYGFVSFVPLLLLVFALVGQRFATRIYLEAPQFLTPDARELVYEAMTTASGQTGASILAIVVLAWSGANIVVGFQTVVERVEDAHDDPLAVQLRDAFVVLGSLCFAFVAIALASLLSTLLPARPPLAGSVVLFVALTAAFLPLYYVPSRLVAAPSGALPGALTAAAGWTVLQTAVQLYATNAARYAIYGVLSGIIVILTALYVAAVVLLIGVVVNAVLADGSGPATALPGG